MRNRLLIITLLISAAFHSLVLILLVTFFGGTQQSRIALRFLPPYLFPVERYRPRHITEGSGIGKGRGMEMFHEGGETFSLPEGSASLSFLPGVGRRTIQIPGEGKGCGCEDGLAYIDRFISTPQGKETGLKGKGGVGIIELEPRGLEMFPRWGSLIPEEVPSPLRDGNFVMDSELGHPSIIAIDPNDKSKTRGFWYLPGVPEYRRNWSSKLKSTGIVVKYSGKKFDMASTDKRALEYPVIYLSHYLSSKYNTIKGLVRYLRKGGFLITQDNHVSVKYNRFYWQVRAEVEKQVGSFAIFLGTEENKFFLNTYYDMRDLGWPTSEGYRVDRNGVVYADVSFGYGVGVYKKSLGPKCPSFSYLESIEIGGRIVAVFVGSTGEWNPVCRMNELDFNILYYSLTQPGSIARQVNIAGVTQRK